MTLNLAGLRSATGGATNHDGASWSASARNAGHAGHGAQSGGQGGQAGWSLGGGYRPGASAGGQAGWSAGAQQGGGQAGWRSLAGYNGRISSAGDIPNLPRGWSTYGFQGQAQRSGPQPGDERAAGIGGMVSRALPPGSLLGRVLGAPLGAFSYLVGHDSALRAARNGDVGGWLVNTQDHGAHTHTLGGNAGGRNAPLAFLGTLGQEAGYLLGLDGIFGDSAAYDRVHGTNYGHDAGEPTHILPIWGRAGGLAGGGQVQGGGQQQAQAGGGAHAGH